MRIDGVRYRKIGQTRVAGTLCDLLVPVDGRGPLRAEPTASVKQAVDDSGASKDGATVGDKERANGEGVKQAGSPIAARAPAAEVGRALAAVVTRYRWPLWLLAVLGVLGALLGCGGHGG